MLGLNTAEYLCTKSSQSRTGVEEDKVDTEKMNGGAKCIGKSSMRHTSKCGKSVVNVWQAVAKVWKSEADWPSCILSTDTQRGKMDLQKWCGSRGGSGSGTLWQCGRIGVAFSGSRGGSVALWQWHTVAAEMLKV